MDAAAATTTNDRHWHASARRRRHGTTLVAAAALALTLSSCLVPNPGAGDLAPGRALPLAAAGRYGSDPLQTFQLYRRVTGASRGTIVWIHGGAWMFGDASPLFIHPGIADQVRHGWSVVSINYRLAPAVDVDDQIADVKAAILYLHSHATALRVDIRRMVVAGHSAGGYLAAMAGSSGDRFLPAGAPAHTYHIDGVVDMAGPAWMPTWATIKSGPILGWSLVRIINTAFGCLATPPTTTTSTTSATSTTSSTTSSTVPATTTTTAPLTTDGGTDDDTRDPGGGVDTATTAATTAPTTTASATTVPATTLPVPTTTLPAPDPERTLVCSRSTLAALSPQSYLDRTDPPIYLAYGGKDTLVPPSQGRDLAAKWAAVVGDSRVWLDIADTSEHEVGTLNNTALTEFLAHMIP